MMAPTTTNYSDIQQNEIEVLSSIYMDDFVIGERKTGPWNKTSDRAFKIFLHRKLKGESKVAITLDVTLPPTYPKTVPRLHIAFDDDVDKRVRMLALDIIKTKPETLVGSEMIYDLTTQIEEVLDVVSDDDPKDIPTLDEERVFREQAALAKSQEEEERKRAEEMQANSGAGDGNEEKQMLFQLVSQEKERTNQRRRSRRSGANDRPPNFHEAPGDIVFDRSCKVQSPSGKRFEVYAVHQKVRYREGPLGTIYTVQVLNTKMSAMLEGTEASSDSPFLCLKEIFIKSDADSETSRKAIQDIEAHLDQQTWSPNSHPNIASPLNYVIKHSQGEGDGSGSGLDGWKISILIPFATRGTLFDLLDLAGAIDIKRMRAWSLEILDALHYLHRSGIAHAALHLKNIVLGQGEAENVIAILTDGGYVHEIHLLKKVVSNDIPAPWIPPENSPDGPTQKDDIWYFGVCLLQMGFGKDILQKYHSPGALFEDLQLSRSFEAITRKIFNSNAKKRPTVWELLHYEFFRNDDSLTVRSNSEMELSASANSTLLPGKRSRRHSTTTMTNSRYAKEFVEEGRLGRGGFGEVFKVRNRIDSQLYAVKKIWARTKAALDPVLSEASVLSRLNHANVVRYFASWIEDGVAAQPDDDSESSVGDPPSSRSKSDRPRFPVSGSKGLDFISSNNMRDNVVFGFDGSDDQQLPDGSSGESETGHHGNYEESDDDDDDDEDEDENYSPPRIESSEGMSTSRGHKDFLRRSSTLENGPSAILYIQMEYCRPETLRDVIKSGIKNDPTEQFRLLRQILQGLSHIHAASIVHRDLKPENVFIDIKGDVRIGDFGLARPGDYRTATGKDAKPLTNFTDFTEEVGTAYYIAPEVLHSGGGKYDEKADMFSLGVILFEMNVDFGTVMEKCKELEQLQEKDFVMPKSLQVPEKAAQADLISQLTRHQPSLRPGSQELLDSGLIPLTEEDETFRLARRMIMDPTSQFRRDFLQSLFEGPRLSGQVGDAESAQQIVLQKLSLVEAFSAMSRPNPEDFELQTLVKQKLTSIFYRHGAVERTDGPVLIPHHAYYHDHNVFTLLHPTGKLYQLPYDLVLPHAMLLAGKEQLKAKRAFLFDHVYRADATKDQPDIYGEMIFDIIDGESEQLVIHEAEAIKTLDEVLDAFPHLAATQMCFHINHSHILDSILEFSGADREKWSDIKETLSRLNVDDWTWNRTRHELRAPPINAPGTALEMLEQFDFRDPLPKAISKIKDLLPDTSHLGSVFGHLEELTSHLSLLGVKRKVYLTPLSCYNEKFYRGNMLFQCLYDQKKRKVFAGGGRYDSLVREHQPIAIQTNRIHVVGFQLTWSGLASGLGSYLRVQAKSKSKHRMPEIDQAAWRRRRCDVLIDSFDKALIPSIGLSLLQELWANEISAELTEDEPRVMNEYGKIEGSSEGHGWIVMIKSEEVVRVRNTVKKEEAEMRPSDLILHIRTEMRERERDAGRSNASKIAPASLYRHISQPEQKAGNDGEHRDPDVKVMTVNTKGKKSNRKNIVEDAVSHAQEWRTNAGEHPIIAIEMKEAMFSALEQKTSTRDQDSWKKFVQGAPVGDKAYLNDLLKLINGYVGKHAAVYLYNFRTKQICYYPLTKG